MSERIHSDAGTPARASAGRSRLFLYCAGTAAAIVVAGVAFQIYRAEPGAAQTRPAQNAGTARVGSTPSDEILARVNAEPVTYEQVARECFERYGADVLENIINRRIIEQECTRVGLQITQGDIDQEVLTVATKFNIDPANWYSLLKSERGLGKAQYHRDVIYPMLALKKLAGQNIQVTPEDLQRAFERDYGPRVEARMILVQGNIRQANEIWNKAQAAPDDFGRLAREFSADPNTRPLGGVIPPIRKFGGSDKIEAEAFKMRVGEISPLIDIGEGRYVILKCEGFTKPIVDDIRQVEQQLQEQLVEEKTQEAVAQVFDILKYRSSVVNYVTGKSSGGPQVSATPQTGLPQTAGPQAAAPPQQGVRNTAIAPIGATR